MKAGLSLWCGICVMVSFVGAASADELSVQIGGGSHRMNAQAYDAIDPNNAHGFANLELGYVFSRLSGNVEGLLVLHSGGDGEAGYRDNFSETLRLDWRVQRVMAGADLGVPIGRFLRPSLRLGVGYAHQRLDMLHSSGEAYVDHAHDVVGFGMIGGRAMVPISFGMGGLGQAPRLKLGVQGHWGYMAQTQAEFDGLEPAYEDEENPWREEPIDLGALPTRGRLFNVGVFVQIRL